MIYYGTKYKFFNNAIIIHDSVFFHKYINFNLLSGINVLPLWHFNSDKDNIDNTKRIIKSLKKTNEIEYSLLNSFNFMNVSHSRWHGFFGVQL